MKLTSNNLIKIWTVLCVVLLAAYVLAIRLESGEAFFLMLNSINALLFFGAVLLRKRIDQAINWLSNTIAGKVDTTQAARIELKYYRENEIGLFFIVTAALAGLYVIWLSLTDTPSYSALIREDGLVEYASALFWILAAIFLVIGMIRPDRNRHIYRFQYLPYVLILLFFIVSAGEEISWGQRIFGLETPEFLKTINVQDELTLHNIGSISVFSNAFFLIAVVFFLLVPFLQARNVSIRTLVDYYSLPAPNRYAVGTFVITLGVWLFIGIRYGTLGFHPFSFYAENFYTQMDDEIFECLTAYSFLSFGVMNSLKSTSVKSL